MHTHTHAHTRTRTHTHTHTAVHGQDPPTVTLGPAQVTGMHEIVSGSDIQLFCSATSTSGVAPDISWTRNGAILENTPPSRYFRTSSDGTTATSSVLTIEDFQSADDGTYFCSGSIPASGGGTVAQSSETAVLTGKVCEFLVALKPDFCHLKRLGSLKTRLL